MDKSTQIVGPSHFLNRAPGPFLVGWGGGGAGAGGGGGGVDPLWEGILTDTSRKVDLYPGDSVGSMWGR